MYLYALPPQKKSYAQALSRKLCTCYVDLDGWLPDDHCRCGFVSTEIAIPIESLDSGRFLYLDGSLDAEVDTAMY